jgi:hypothetical protein
MLEEEYHCFPYPFLYKVSRDPAHCARSSILQEGYHCFPYPFLSEVSRDPAHCARSSILQEEYHCFPYPFLSEVSRDPALHCARSSILVLGITRYTLLVFPYHSTLLGRVFDQKGQEQRKRGILAQMTSIWNIQFPLRFEHVLMNIPVFFCRKFPVLHSTACTLHIYTSRVTYI